MQKTITIEGRKYTGRQLLAIPERTASGERVVVDGAVLAWPVVLDDLGRATVCPEDEADAVFIAWFEGKHRLVAL